MSARNMPGISAGGTRATSRTVMPSRTPIGISLVAVGDEARGQRPDVGDGFQVLELLGGERLIVMTGGPARGRSQRAAVTEPHGHAISRSPPRRCAPSSSLAAK